MFRPGCWLVFAAIIALPSTGFAQVQVNQNFVTQGPAPSFGPTATVQSGDAPPNGNVAGAVGPIVADPIDPNTFYIGGLAGGVWKTTNGGTTWTPLSDNQSTTSIASLAQDPTNRNALIAGTGLTANGTVCSTGSCFFTGSGGLRNGVLYSANGGATWSELGGATLAGQTVDAVAARGNVLIAGTFEPSFAASAAQQRVGGLYRSIDGGANFTLVSGTGGLPLGPATSIIGDPNNSNRLYAAVTTPNAGANANTAVFVSNDTGANWTQVFGAAQSNGTIQASSQTVLKVATGPGGVIAVGVVDMATKTVTGLFWSNNSGTTWTTLTVPVLNNGGQAPVNFAIAVSPTNPNLVFVSGDQNGVSPFFTVTAFRIDALNTPGTATSITNANTSNGSTVHADSRDIAFDANGRLLLSSDGTIYARTNPQNDTGAWARVSGNLSLFETARVAYDAVGKRLMVAAQDNGVTIQSARNSLNWNATHGADGINAFVNDVTLAGAGRTAFYGNTQDLGFLARIVLDAQGNQISPNTAGFGFGATVTCNGIACSTAVAGEWFSSPWVNNRVDPTRMALGGDNVYVTQDTLTGAQAPTVATVDLTLTDLGPTGSFVTKIAYGTRDNPNFVLVGAGNGIWQSTTAAAGSLVNVPAYTGLAPTGVVSDPRSQNRYFVADNVDLFGTTNQGASFTTLTGNLPAGIIRPTAVEFISNNGVNALLVGSLGSVANLQSTIVTADSDAAGVLSNWRLFGNGLPNTQVNSLSYNAAVDVLAVGTFGRGVFTIYDVTSYFPQATVLQFGLADNDSMPDASFLTNGTSASRQLIKYGIGTLTIAGDATYTGSTTINRGAVVLGVGGSSGSILGNVTFCNNAADPNCDASNNKTLAFNRSDTYTFGGSITGPGQVFQIGSGKTVLTGASDYTGPTFVNAGTLSVNGSITSSVFVNSGGTLGGNGSVGATTILPGGALSPGNSVGLITVNGNLVFNPGSLYFVEIFGNTADRTNVTGTATLAGTVVASFTGGTLTNRYTILSAAGGRTGTFDSLTQVNAPAPFLTASLVYTPTDVLLNLNSTIIQTPGLTSNEAAVAAALDASFNSGRGTLPGLFGLSRAQLAAAMDALSGEGTSGTQQTAFDAADMFMSTMMDQGAFWRSRNSVDVNGVTYGAAGPMQYAPSRKPQHPAFKAIDKSPLPPIYEPRWRAWTTGFGGVWKLNGEAGIGSASLTHDIAGGAAGLDYQFTPDILLGLAAGGSSSNFAVRDRITSGHLEAGHFGGYGVKTWGSFYTAGALSFNIYRNDTSRTIAGVGPIETATGNFGSNMWSGRLELGYRAQILPAFSVTPFMAVQFSELRQNGYTETNVTPPGAGVLGLSYASRTVSSLPTFVGTQLEGSVYLPYGLILSPYGRFSWVHEFKPNREIDPSFIALPGTLFSIDGARAARDAARVEVGSKLTINRYVKAFINYEGEYSSRSQSYAGKAGFSVSW